MLRIGRLGNEAGLGRFGDGFGGEREKFGKRRGIAELIDLIAFQQTIVAGRDAFDREMAEGDALDLLDGMPFREERAAEHIEASASGLRFVPIIGGVAARRIGLANGAEMNAGFLGEAIEFGKGEAALDLDEEGLRELVPDAENGGSEVAIVGEQDEAAVVVIESADGIDALGKTAQEIAKGAAILRIGEMGDDFGRFVDDEIGGLFCGIDEAAGNFDAVGIGVGLGAELGDDVAVDANLTGDDELFGVAARGDAGVGNDFLEAIEHKGNYTERREREIGERGISGRAGRGR